MIRLTIDMPRLVWWLALHFRLAIALEVEGEVLAPLDLVQHGRPLTLIYGGGGLDSLAASQRPALRHNTVRQERPEAPATPNPLPFSTPTGSQWFVQGWTAACRQRLWSPSSCPIRTWADCLPPVPS